MNHECFEIFLKQRERVHQHLKRFRLQLTLKTTTDRQCKTRNANKVKSKGSKRTQLDKNGKATTINAHYEPQFISLTKNRCLIL